MIRNNPTVQIPRWTLFDNNYSDDSDEGELADPPTGLYSCDEFRMYEFKVRRCARGRAHDWTDCPYAHPGEKAQRRDPRRFHYSGSPCPEFKKPGGCPKADSCEFAHGVFECWLHPARYRTQPCKDGTACRRRVCFFAHTPDQLRVLSPKLAVLQPESYDGWPMRMKSSMGVMASSPTSILSPPVMRKMSLCGSFGFNSLPSTPRAKRAVGFEESESFDGLDVGWVSELVK